MRRAAARRVGRARVDRGAIRSRLQYDYLEAYLSLYTDDRATARAHTFQLDQTFIRDALTQANGQPVEQPVIEYEDLGGGQ